MRQIGNRQLWIGHSGDLSKPASILALGILAVIEVADNEQMALLPRDLIRLRFPLSDDGNNPNWLIKLSAKSLADLIHASIPTIVCCSAGMSRSVCLCAAGLALAEKISFDESISIVTQNGPADISPSLFYQFRAISELCSQPES